MSVSAFDLVSLIAAFSLPLLILMLSLPPFLRYLRRTGRTVSDVHKQEATQVPSPVGPLLLLSLVVGELAAYAFYPRSLIPLATVGCVLLAFAVGIMDDLYVVGGKTKPLLLCLTAVPLVAAQYIQSGVYSARLAFPILGRFALGEHFSIYTVLVIAAFPIVSNAFNMMDSFNGEMSGFSVLTSLALTFGIALHVATSKDFSIGHIAAALPLVAVSIGFYVFNKFPSKAFDGNSGSLVLGTMFATLAVTGGVEIAAVVALIPAILNSFYILSSVRGFVERRSMGTRPTQMGSDGKIYASTDPSAPVTLIRMILADGPLTEQELVRNVLLLTGASCLLSIVTSILTWVH
ncbi:MAG TPA: hypothetical protein VEJ36_04220 [Nitrososphaerales archaeon]|nr:hypothetical protein [Nitrososphaerales archaeon]